MGNQSNSAVQVQYIRLHSAAGSRYRVAVTGPSWRCGPSNVPHGTHTWSIDSSTLYEVCVSECVQQKPQCSFYAFITQTVFKYNLAFVSLSEMKTEDPSVRPSVSLLRCSPGSSTRQVATSCGK